MVKTSPHRNSDGNRGGKRQPGQSQKKPVANSARLVLLNKPYGVLSQFTGGDKTLADLVPVKEVYPAGRLDKDSEGLLLLTDHGPLQHRISHPARKLQKYYWVQVEGLVTDEALRNLCEGVMLNDGSAKALSATRIKAPDVWPRQPPVRYRASVPDCWIQICLSEGRNRQIRRMTAAVGFPTLRLVRHQIGEWTIKNIPSGKYLTIVYKSEQLTRLLDD